MPSAHASAATSRLNRAISACSGDNGVRARWASRAMRPNSVRMPVANTSTVAAPATTAVPASTTLRLASRFSPAVSRASLSLAIDSPVMVASLMRNPCASMTRQSAGTWSPSCSRMMSPGTSSSAASCNASPSRKTMTFAGNSFASAVIARSARYSCQNENTPLIRMTPTIAAANGPSPESGSRHCATSARAAASHRISAKKLVNCTSSRSHGGACWIFSRRLPPYSAHRRAASADTSPCRLLFRLASAASTLIWLIFMVPCRTATTDPAAWPWAAQERS